MRKPVTLLILLFIWTAGMTQEAVYLKTSNANGKTFNNQTNSSLLTTNVAPVTKIQAGNIVIPDLQVKSPVCVSNTPNKKKGNMLTNYIAPVTPNPLAPMQGGDVIATATVIGSLPYSNTGTTAGYINDYDEVCPYGGGTAPDVVYAYTPAASGNIDIDLNGSAYDTKLYVYENTTATLVACNDDFYANYVSALFAVSLTAGNTYYIIIDGYGTSSGAYAISVTSSNPPPANDECTGATAVTGPFPQTITGTSIGATIDCPGLLDWNAVWYAVTLPYAVNDLTVDWCGTADMSTVGIVYYPTCPVVCGDYVVSNTNVFAICGLIPDATTAISTFLNIPGPTTIYYPAYSLPLMDHQITFNVVAVVCPAPTALVVSDRTTTSAKLGWTAGGTESTWNIEVGLPGFAPGAGEYLFRGSPTSNTFSASALSIGTRYSFYVQSDCGTEQSAWVGPVSFSTLIQCPAGAITELEVCSDSTNNACNNVIPANQTSEPLLSGQTVCGTSFYDGTGRDTDWFSFTVTGTKDVTLSGKADFDLQLLLATSPCPASVIAAGTALSGQTASVLSQLTAGNYYAWVGPQFTGIFACETENNYYATLTIADIAAYCIPAPTSVDELGITNVAFSTVNNASGAETGNYGDYSALIGDVQRTVTIPVLITFETGYTYDTKIWIDWNNDYLFTGIGEEVYSGTSLADNPTTLAASFLVPAGATLGNHRMRIGAVDFGPPTPCYTGSYGTFEDYTVNVTAAPACPSPSALTVSNILPNQADLGWTENGSSTLWNVKWGAPGFDPITQGTLISGVTNPYTLTGLTAATSYAFYVQADCGAGSLSAWSGPAVFTTACDALSLPYTQNFDGVTPPAIPLCMTVTNDNADAISWVTSTSLPRSTPNSMRIGYNASLAMDDWFFTPGFNLLPGTYMVSFWYRGNGSYPEALEVQWGNAPNAAGMTSGPVFDNNNILTTTYMEGTCVITITNPGTYYVGWHGYSDADMFYMLVDDISINPAPTTRTLNLTGVLLEGLYAGGGTMNQALSETGPQYDPGVADVITVELHNEFDYTTLDYPPITGVELSTSGTASVTTIPSTLDGNYYITVKHRNSVETTTVNAVPFDESIINQSFATPADVYGGNLLLMMDMGYAIYGGDVNQDGYVDTADGTDVDNDQFNFVGGYVATDVNGDGFVDTADGTIIDNNQFNFVGSILP